MTGEHARRHRRLAALVALGGAVTLVAGACTWARPRPPVTTPTTATTVAPAPTTTAGPTPTTAPSPGSGWSCSGPSGGGSDHGDHGDHGHGGSGGIDTGGAHNIPARLNHPPTAEQRRVADQLIADTKAAAARFADYKVAESLGYKSIGDNRSGVAHYVNLQKRRDGRILDPAHVESLVYKTDPRTGAVVNLQTFMYIGEDNCTMDTIPDIAGNLTVWHAHDNLCYKRSDPGVLAGILINGQCFPANPDAVFIPSPPMLHVWIVDNPCGPFAGTDAGNRTGSCSHGH